PPDEAEAAPLQVLRHRLRLGGLRWELAELGDRVVNRTTVHERPQVLDEAGPGALERQRRAGVVDRGLDLGAIADDARIEHQPIDVVEAERRDALRLETEERRPVPVALAQDRRPGQ